MAQVNNWKNILEQYPITVGIWENKYKNSLLVQDFIELFGGTFVKTIERVGSIAWINDEHDYYDILDNEELFLRKLEQSVQYGQNLFISIRDR